MNVKYEKFLCVLWIFRINADINTLNMLRNHIGKLLDTLIHKKIEKFNCMWSSFY